MGRERAEKKRPTGVTILAVLEILGGLGNIAIGVLLWVAFAMLGAMTGGIPEGAAEAYMFGAILEIMGIILGGIIVVIGIVSLVIAYGFLTGKGWAWMLGLIFSIISTIFGILMLPQGIITIIFNAIILYYLTRPYVKQFFGRAA